MKNICKLWINIEWILKFWNRFRRFWEKVEEKSSFIPRAAIFSNLDEFSKLNDLLWDCNILVCPLRLWLLCCSKKFYKNRRYFSKLFFLIWKQRPERSNRKLISAISSKQFWTSTIDLELLVFIKFIIISNYKNGLTDR